MSRPTFTSNLARTHRFRFTRNASFTTLPPVNEPKFITHPSVLLKDTHDPSNIPTSTRKHQGIPRVGSLPPHRPESGNTTFCGMHTTSDYARAADLITLREPYREILSTASAARPTVLARHARKPCGDTTLFWNRYSRYLLYRYPHMPTERYSRYKRYSSDKGPRTAVQR